MLDVLIWWLIVELVGIAVLPIAFRFFRGLPDRGYAFIKPLGLLLIAYPFWLLTTLGFLTNTRGAIALVAIVVAGVSWWFANRPQTTRTNCVQDDRPLTMENAESTPPATRHSPLAEWLGENRTLIIITELVFTLAFLLWVCVRAYMPEITATEKPMEFAFLNGVLQSEHFPPLDPWLSGYAISYYYFGYVIMAMLTRLSGIAPSVAFNLAIALLFALGATGAYGLVYNLVRKSQIKIGQARALFFSVFAPVFLLLIGNLEGVLESLHARGIGSLDFWNWVDVKGLVDVPATGSFVPTDNWWWWRASRVIHDFALGQTQEVIDEFPQFSFLLGDMHPHVLALPFVLLALAVALNMLAWRSEIRDSRLVRGLGFEFRLLNFEFLLLPLILGGLFFLNSWDILPYGFILVAAFVIARYRVENKWDTAAWRDAIVFVVALGALSIIFYVPFFIGFQSQAAGLLPVLFVKTRLHQYLLMFGLFVVVLGAFLAPLISEHRDIKLRDWLDRALPFVAAIVIFPLLVGGLAFVAISVSPSLQEQARSVLPSIGNNVVGAVLAAYFTPWLSDPGLFIVLAVLLTTILVLARLRLMDETTIFVLLVAFTGFLLTFGVEFVYLRDQFGTRMNTVFKFYFQAWTLFSIAAAYAVFYLSHKLSGIVRGVWFVTLAVLLGASLIYPAMAIPNRADDFKKTPTLDGLAWIRDTNPGDYSAIMWLKTNASQGSVVLEATGKDYSYDNRISMATGFPTLLGWFGHESQWHGNTDLFKNDATGVDRPADIQRIYQTLDSKELLTLLDKYAIKFVVVGSLERNAYGLTKTQIDKFGKVMSLVHEDDDVRIYARTN